MSNRLQQLHAAGQSIWLDYIDRTMLYNGDLARRIRDDALTGMTSNPTIFEKALAEGNVYDDQIRSATGSMTAMELFELVETSDVRDACDIFAGVHRDSKGNDGFVSIEVSPGAANDMRATVSEAERLWATVKRPNVMIKIPGTAEGAKAVERATAAGINVNITLLFAIDAYAAVIEAYMRGLEERVKAAIANAKLAYALFQKQVATPRWKALAAKGATVQRPLWASTSTKNPAYRDVMYVEQLIGPDTVNTMPPQTITAFLDHGDVKRTVDVDVDKAQQTIAMLEQHGIMMRDVTDKLLVDGVASFQKSFDELSAG